MEQRLCLALALWNGRDPILKERIFGLTGSEGNHGEDAKEYWWYLDALPSHAWNRWRYHYPQRAFPYEDLVAENGRRGKLDPEYELLDTDAFDEDRYWIVDATYAKGDAQDLLLTIRVTNAGPEADTLHVLPTAWYRNTWSWGLDGETKPELRLEGSGRVVTRHPFLGELELVAQGEPEVLFCENETNSERLYGTPSATPTPKDGINDHVVSGAATVAPDAGTKAAFWFRLEVPAGETATVRVRLRPTGRRRQPVDRLRRDGRDARARGGRVLRRAHPAGGERRRGARPSPGARRDALEQAALRLRRRALARRRPDPAEAAGLRLHGATPAGAPSTPSTSCRCPTSGSTRGSRRGISPSTASPSRASTRPSRSTS